MVRDNLLRIKERIQSACLRVNRDLGSVTIVAVSKGRTVEQIKEAIAAGITDIGDNRVQEALLKYNALRTAPDAQRIKRHMVGHLQTNKVREAVKLFDLIQCVDSLHLAQEIEKQAKKAGKIQDILIEIKTSYEATKFGLKPEEALRVIAEIAKLKNLNIKGLMTIAPVVDSAEKARPYFRMLRDLRGEINQQYELNVLSMGMTDDFEVAIEEGANMVRLGRAIFE